MASITLGKANLPSALSGQSNGQVALSLLFKIEDNRPGINFLMAENPARAMRAMHAEGRKAGHHFTSTGRGRTTRGQTDMWLQRMEPCSQAEYNATPKDRRRTWSLEGRLQVAAELGITIPNAYYWRKKRYPDGSYPASCAVPKTSNHGWWCADDMALLVKGKIVALTNAAIQWLYDNAPSFGFVWELISEKWHLTWAVGNKIPARVLAYEAASGTTPTPGPQIPPDFGTTAAAINAAKKFILSKGMGGKDAPKQERDAVYWMRVGLNQNMPGKDIATDGEFGPITDKALRAFQEMEEIKVDGLCGPVTWRHLFP